MAFSTRNQPLAFKGRLERHTGFPYILPRNDRVYPAKDAANVAKHGVSLTQGDRLFSDTDHLIVPTIREEDREDRFELFISVFVRRDDLPRFISVRRSSDGEERRYRDPG